MEQQPSQAAPPELETATYAVLVGTVGERIVDERFPDSTKLPFDSINDAVLALLSCKADYVVTAYTNSLNFVRENPGKLVTLPNQLTNEGNAIAVNKSETELLAAIDQVLEQFRQDGTLERIVSNWIREDGSDYIRDEISVLPDAPILWVAMSAEREPMCFVENGQIVGLDAELIQRIAYEMGMRVEFEDMKFSAMIPSVLSGKTPVAISNISATEERRQSVNFSTSYYLNPQVILTRTEFYPEGASAAPDEADDQGNFFSSLADSFRKTFTVEGRWKLILSGIGITLLLSVCSGLLGILVGFGFCLLRMSRQSALRGVVAAVTRILQGTPMVVLLMIFYYVVFNKTGLDGVTVAIIAFGLNFGAYGSEIMLSGIRAVDNGQREAAAALGFPPARTFARIVFPQAASHFLPVLKSEYISVVKMTSIVGYVAVQDLTKVSDMIRSRTYEAFFPLIVTALLYFLLSFGLSSLLRIVEVRIDPKHRPRTLKGVEL